MRGRIGPFWFAAFPAGVNVGLGFFRVLVRDTSKHEPLFSERHGLDRWHHVGRFKWQVRRGSGLQP